MCCVLQLAGGVILGVALWLRHEPKTSNLLDVKFDGAHPPSTFYISTYLICTISTLCLCLRLPAVTLSCEKCLSQSCGHSSVIEQHVA